MSFYDQSNFDVRCEWGLKGVEQLAPISDVVIIVDVLSFSTCVEISTQRGAIVYPYAWGEDEAHHFAESVGAELALRRQVNGSPDNGDTSPFPHRPSHPSYSLSPQSLSQIPEGTRLVLPSPNGSTLSLKTGDTPTLAGCLRNCRAVALSAMRIGRRIAVIPAGEKWEDGGLRPAIEDWIGAGAILSYLQGQQSPEAKGAIATYQATAPNLKTLIQQCSSGRELIGKGFAADVDLAVELNISDAVPRLIDRAYRRQT